MATYSALPATLDINIVQGDEFRVVLSFGEDLTGFTFDAQIYKALAIQNGVVTSREAIEGVALDLEVIDAATGVVAISLTETQTDLLVPGSVYRWFLRWANPQDVTRTVLTGTVNTRSP